MERELVELFEKAKKAADDADSPNQPEVLRCVDALKRLKTLPVTSEVLVSTQIGKRLRSLTKHPTKEISSVANELLDIWKKVVMEEVAKKKNGITDKGHPVKALVSKSETVNVEKCESTSSVKVEKSSRVESVKIEKISCEAGTKVNEGHKVSSTTVSVAPPKLTALVKCNNVSRDKIREFLVEAMSKVADEVDEDMRDEVNACDPIRVAVLVESVMFEKMGLSTGSQKVKYRSIMFNLKDPKNPDFRRKVLLGQVKPERIINMTAEEMASDQRQMENQQIKEKALFNAEAGGPPKATTDQFRCGRCGQRKCTYYQMQTRSADEPMTTYVTCVNCNNHWKFC